MQDLCGYTPAPAARCDQLLTKLGRKEQRKEGADVSCQQLKATIAGTTRLVLLSLNYRTTIGLSGCQGDTTVNNT